MSNDVTETHVDEEAALAAGVQLTESVSVNYWGFYQDKIVTLPDGVQTVTIKKMNEGDKAAYQSSTRSDIRVTRQTGDAHLKADPAAERHALLIACITGWDIKGPNGEQIPFNKESGPYSLKAWLRVADPSVIELLEKECRKFNPWLLAELSVEDIDKELENLQEMRAEAVKREQGE